MPTTENHRINAILSAYDSALNRIENGLSISPQREAESVRLFALAVNSAESDDEISELQRAFTPGSTTGLQILLESWGRDFNCLVMSEDQA